MIRFVIIAAILLIVLGGFYVSEETYETVSAVAITAQDLSSASDTKTNTGADNSSYVGAAVTPVALTGIAAKFSSSLIALDDNGAPQPVDTQKLAGVKYWAFYYSASWCPPCRAFTPDLVAFYKAFKPAHPDFDLIFVNDDRNQDDMLNYMRNDGMPWPAVRYVDIDNPDLQAKKYCGDGIPDLVLVDADGNVLSDTYQNGQYTDPHHVIDDIRTMVK